jgi:hypothetical protein
MLGMADENCYGLRIFVILRLISAKTIMCSVFCGTVTA